MFRNIGILDSKRQAVAAGGGGIPTDYEWYWSFDAQDTTDDAGGGYDGVYYDATTLAQATFPSWGSGYGWKSNGPAQATRSGIGAGTHTSTPILANVTAKYVMPADDSFTFSFFYDMVETTWTNYASGVRGTATGGDRRSQLVIWHGADNNKPSLNCWNGSAWTSALSATALSPGTKYSIIWTYDGVDQFELYVDGSNVASLTKTSMTLTGDPTAIGTDWFDGGGYFGGPGEGTYNGVRFYNRVCDAAEITALAGETF